MPLVLKAGSLLMKGQHQDALGSARNALQVYPIHNPAFLIAIASLMHLGRGEDAKDMA
jgi:hypothetical protein